MAFGIASGAVKVARALKKKKRKKNGKGKKEPERSPKPFTTTSNLAGLGGSLLPAAAGVAVLLGIVTVVKNTRR